MDMDMDEEEAQAQGQEGRKRKRGRQGWSTRAGRVEVELASDAFLTMPMLLAFLVRACVCLSIDGTIPIDSDHQGLMFPF